MRHVSLSKDLASLLNDFSAVGPHQHTAFIYGQWLPHLSCRYVTTDGAPPRPSPNWHPFKTFPTKLAHIIHSERPASLPRKRTQPLHRRDTRRSNSDTILPPPALRLKPRVPRKQNTNQDFVSPYGDSLHWKTGTDGLFSARSTPAAPSLPRHRSLVSSWNSRPRWQKRAKSTSRMHCHLQFVTTPTVDTPGTGLLLVFDDHRYLFGQIHEGFQRAGLEIGLKYPKLKEIFVSGIVDWQSVGGLFGTLLTYADVQVKKAELDEESDRAKASRVPEAKARREGETNAVKRELSDTRFREAVRLNGSTEAMGLHGGQNITHAVAASRFCILRQSTPIEVKEYREEANRNRSASDSEPTWSDERIRVWAIGVTANKDTGDTSEFPIPMGSRKRGLKEYMREFAEDHVSDPAVRQGEDDEERIHRDQVVRQRALRKMFLTKTEPRTLSEKPAIVQDEVFQGGIKEVNKRSPSNTRGHATGQTQANDSDRSLPSTSPSQTATSYIVRNYPQKGKFDPATAASLGIPSGMVRAQLVNGQPVVLEDGRQVTPEMVMSPSKPGEGFALFDLPSQDHMARLLKMVEAEMIGLDDINTFVWILGPGISDGNNFRKLLERFHGRQHIMSSPEQCPNRLMMRAAGIFATTHHHIDNERFNELRFRNEPNPSLTSTKAMPQALHGVSLAQPGVKVRIQPKPAVEQESALDFVDLAEGAHALSAQTTSLCQDALKAVEEMRKESSAGDEFPPSPNAEITFLGTGSSSPSMMRNVCGIMLRVPGHGTYLFDPGEGTIGQMRRMYQPSEVSEILQDLKMIWVSHNHGDHCLGLPGVIKAWSEELQRHKHLPETPKGSTTTEWASILSGSNRLFVVASSGVARWLSEVSEVDDLGMGRVVPLVSSHSPEFRRHRLSYRGVDVEFQQGPSQGSRSAIFKAMSLSNLTACKVPHCLGSQAVSVTFSTGFKFSYSGDCRPSQKFIEMGRGSTVLVHEATFDDSLDVEAFRKRHSTISSAIRVGLDMQAQNLILTHFSQRYSKLPTLSDVWQNAGRPEDRLEDESEEETTEAVVDESVEEMSTFAMETQSNTETDPEPGSQTLANLLPDSQKVAGLTEKDSPNKEEFPASVQAMNIGVAFDYMKVLVKDIKYLHKYVPAFTQHYQEVEERAEQERAKLREAEMANQRVKEERIEQKRAQLREQQLAAEQARQLRREQKKAGQQVKEGKNGLQTVEPKAKGKKFQEKKAESKAKKMSEQRAAKRPVEEETTVQEDVEPKVKKMSEPRAAKESVDEMKTEQEDVEPKAEEMKS